MDTHKNAREEKVRAVTQDGLSKAAAARQFSTTAKIVTKRVERFRAEGADRRLGALSMHDRRKGGRRITLGATKPLMSPVLSEICASAFRVTAGSSF